MSDILDMLIVGGGPAGTAAAFRAKELGLDALVIDFDDILKRIRDYSKDKQILPDFGGGDKQAFPDGEQYVRALHFSPIDKDQMHKDWKALYEQFDIPVRTGVELMGITRADDVWQVNTWDRKGAAELVLHARHI